MITNFILIMVVLKFTSSVPQQVGLPVLPTSSRLPFQFTDIDDLPRRRFPVSFRSPTSQVGSFDPRLPTSPQYPYQQPHLVGPSGIVLSDGNIVQTFQDQPLSNNQHPAPQPISAVKLTPTRTTTTTASTECSCIFGHKCYNDGDYLDDTCLELQCSSGTWTGTELRTRPDCRKCLAHGDPHMVPYESTNYEIFQTGDFAITQPGFNNSALFGVYGKFEKCGPDISCVRSITYKEPGLTITLGLPTSRISKAFCSKSPQKANSKTCVTTLKVNNKEHTTPNGHEADPFTGTSGNVLVFKHNYINGLLDLYCIAIVGSQGLSMALCQHKDNWPSLYVYAMPSLERPETSLLYGLCNIYTRSGFTSKKEYTMRSMATTMNKDEFVTSWKVPSPNQ